MITRILTYLSSLVIGATMLFSPGARYGQAATAVPQEPGPDQPSDTAAARRGIWLFQGDRIVKRGLEQATVEVTGMRPSEVRAALRDGKTVREIAEGAGKSEMDVLAVYDRGVKKVFDQAVKNGKLPVSLAQSRVAWFEAAARQMTDQPGLTPAYPGLHQLHVALITAAVRVGGLERSEVRSQLETCRTLDEILQDQAHSGQEAVDFAMQKIDGLMDRLVEAGKLSAALRESWHNGISDALGKMVVTPGLHVAGKQCSQPS